MENRLRHLAVEALFPRFCMACGAEGTLMCGRCLDVWTPMPAPASCAFCAREGTARTCFDCGQSAYLDGLSFYLPYANPVVRGLLQAWKYDGDRTAESPLLTLLRRAAPRLAPPVKAFVAMHVPLHESRLRERGFDQAGIVASWAVELFGIPQESTLRRNKKTPARARTSHEARELGQMDGIFEVVPGADVPEHVLLCDDVFTSGATIDAAARALKEAGAQTVWGFTIARG